MQPYILTAGWIISSHVLSSTWLFMLYTFPFPSYLGTCWYYHRNSRSMTGHGQPLRHLMHIYRSRTLKFAKRASGHLVLKSPNVMMHTAFIVPHWYTENGARVHDHICFCFLRYRRMIRIADWRRWHTLQSQLQVVANTVPKPIVGFSKWSINSRRQRAQTSRSKLCLWIQKAQLCVLWTGSTNRKCSYEALRGLQWFMRFTFPLDVEGSWVCIR